MKPITGIIFLYFTTCLFAYGQETFIGGTTDWYWKLQRMTDTGALHFYNKRATSDPEIERVKFFELGGMQLNGNLIIRGSDNGISHSAIEFYRGTWHKFVKMGQANPNAANSPFDFEDFNGNDFRFVFSGNEALRIQASTRRVGIGTANPDQMLTVKGAIHTNEVIVDLNPPIEQGPDYVFENDYSLLPLAELEAYIKANKHLPEVPSANEMAAEGLNLKEMNLLLLKKVEELTLHLIEANKKIEETNQKVKMLEINVARSQE